MRTICSQVHINMLFLLLLLLTSALIQVVANPQGYPPPGPHNYHYRYGKNPTAVRDPKVLKIYELIYPYYQRPRYRYPFYDHEGNGELLYGYGGRRLYKYTVFKPVEGYLRR